MGNYSSGDVAALPGGVDDLEHIYDEADLAAVATAGDASFVSQSATGEIAIHQYKDTETGQSVDITWIGQSDYDCADYPVSLQVYKFSTTTWETLATNNTQTANNNFTLQKLGQATTGYVDGSNVLTCRVYQSAAAAETLMDSYPEANLNEAEYQTIDVTTYTFMGQTFTGNGDKITRVIFYLRKVSSPTGSIVAKVFPHTGNWGTTGVPNAANPTATALGVSDNVDVATLNASALTAVEFTFTGAEQYTTTNTTKYCVGVFYAGSGGTVRVAADSSSPSHGGNFIDWNTGGWWDYDAGRDAIFYIYGT